MDDERKLELQFDAKEDMDELSSMRDTIGDDNHSKGSRSKKSKRFRGEREMVKHVSIADTATGIVLFEKVFRWAEKAQTTMVGSLAQSFYQFAKEVDDGAISSVNFELNVPAKHRRTASSNFRARAVRTPSDTMKMVCIRGEKVIISIFYDMKGGSAITPPAYERLQQYMAALHSQFEESFAAALEACKPEVKAAADAATVDEEQMTAIRSNFVSFEEVVDRLREEIFPVSTHMSSSSVGTNSSAQRASLGLAKGSMQNMYS